MYLRDLVNVWDKEAALLKIYIQKQIIEALLNSQTSVVFNYARYGSYAVLYCIVWLFEKGFEVIDTKNDKTFIIRW